MKILIIGSKGSYGKWLSGILSDQKEDYDIIGTDQDETSNIIDFTRNIKESDVILCVASLVSTVHILKFVCENARKDSLVVDFSSSKKEVCNLMSCGKSDFLMLHPMCAPPENSEKIPNTKRVYAINDYRLDNPENALFYKKLKDAIGGNFVGISMDDHNVVDEMQAITHYLMLSFASFVAFVVEKSDMDYETLKRHSTPVSKPLFESLERLMDKGNPETSAKLIELSWRYNSIPFKSAFNFVYRNKLKGINRYVEILSKRITRIRRTIFG
jgi:prephenate dehydrogenase